MLRDVHRAITPQLPQQPQDFPDNSAQQHCRLPKRKHSNTELPAHPINQHSSNRDELPGPGLCPTGNFQWDFYSEPGWEGGGREHLGAPAREADPQHHQLVPLTGEVTDPQLIRYGTRKGQYRKLAQAHHFRACKKKGWLIYVLPLVFASNPSCHLSFLVLFQSIPVHHWHCPTH